MGGFAGRSVANDYRRTVGMAWRGQNMTKPCQWPAEHRPGHVAFGVPASWVIRDRATGRPVLETYSLSVVSKVNEAKYETVSILAHLQSLNRA